MRIKVKAIGVNRADVFHRQGKYPAFGLEVAGITEDGQRVMAIVNDGGYAKEVEIEDGSWVEIPEKFSFVEAASIIEGLYTSCYNLLILGGLKAGEHVLIHGGASGIGVIAIQLAKLAGADVAATAGKPEKLKLIQSLGAEAIDYHGADFGRDKYDVILDMVGADYFAANLKSLKNGGRLGIIAFISGAEVTAKLSPILLKNLMVFGSMIRTLPNEKKAQIRDGFMPYIGKIRPVVDKVFGFGEIEAALDYVEAYRNVGKVVVEV